jgi:hypothetical protein
VLGWRRECFELEGLVVAIGCCQDGRSCRIRFEIQGLVVVRLNFNSSTRLLHTTVEINHDLDAVVSCPLNSLVHVGELTLHIWVTSKRSDGPVSDWDSDVVQASSGNLLEIVFDNPCVPVIVESVESFSLSEVLSIGIFVHNSITARVDEERWSNPWFENEPSSKVDSANLLIVVVKREGSFV